MPWFQKLCRNTGLTLHGVMHPEDDPRKKTMKKNVEEKRLSDTVTLRRTTVEEVELKRDPAEKTEGP